MPEVEITIGEVARRLDRVEQRMERGFTDMHRTIEAQGFVPVGTYNAEKAALTDRVVALESTVTWVSRTLWGLVGSVGVAILVTILTVGLR